MSEEGKLMTNRQLSQLCAKGLCEWAVINEQLVRHSYDYTLECQDAPVPETTVIRPFEKVFLTNADGNSWYKPTEDAFTALIGGDRARHILGF